MTKQASMKQLSPKSRTDAFCQLTHYIPLAIITSVILWIWSTASNNKIMTFVMNSRGKCNASLDWLAFLINKACQEYPSYFFHFYVETRAAAQNSLLRNYYRSWIDYLTNCYSRVKPLRCYFLSINKYSGCKKYNHAILLALTYWIIICKNIRFRVILWYFRTIRNNLIPRKWKV